MTTKTPCPNTFEGSKFQFIDASKYSTEYRYSLKRLFADCAQLKNIDLLGFKTSHIQDMQEMFMGCTSLVEIDLSFFDTNNCEKMDGMFEGCTSLQNLDLTNFNISKVSSMSRMFKDCTSLEVIDMSGFDLSCKETSDMFDSCFNLKTVIVKDCNKQTVETIILEYFKRFHRIVNFEPDNFGIKNANKLSLSRSESYLCCQYQLGLIKISTRS